MGKLMSEYMKLRAQFLNDHPYCQWFLAERGYDWEFINTPFDSFKHAADFPRSTEIHHKKGRGKFLLDTSTWMAVSRKSHILIHKNVKDSYSKGYLLPRV
jgi:hypothetical protein